MPNHVKNRLVIKGSAEQVKEVKDFLKLNWENPNESVAIDFNNITPMPKWVYQGNLGKKEEEKYGAENCWYKWSIKNWGTKWNAYRTSEKDNIIEFETAWNGVLELITKLGVIFPNIEFEYLFAEEVNLDVGKYKFKDTNITCIQLSTKQAEELAIELWGNEK